MNSKQNKLRAAVCVFFAHMLSIMLVGCGMTIETKSDPRFKAILGRDVLTKRPLRLYRIDPNLTGGNGVRVQLLDKHRRGGKNMGWHAAFAFSQQALFIMSWLGETGGRPSFMMTMTGASSFTRLVRPVT
jgi:hypothetical protein